MISFREYLNESSDYWQKAQIKLLERIQKEFAGLCKGLTEKDWHDVAKVDGDLIYFSDKKGFVAGNQKIRKIYVVVNEYYDDVYLAAKDDNKYWWYLKPNDPITGSGEGFGVCHDGGNPLADEDREEYFDEGVRAFVSKWDDFKKNLSFAIRTREK